MKKNKVLVFLLLIGVLFTIAASKKGNYTVQGKINGGQDGDTVLLVQLEGWAMYPLDTTVIKKGKFEFKGTQEKPALRYILCTRNGETIGGTSFILENGKIAANIDPAKRLDVKGTPNNELWNIYIAETEKQSALVDSYYLTANDSTVSAEVRVAANEKIKQFKKEQKEYNLNFIRKNIKNGVAHVLLESSYLSFPLEDLELISLDMKKAHLNNELSETLNDHINALRKTKIGSLYSDLSLSSDKGQIVQLSDYIHKNQVTLIDFWASWCGPCLQEIPHLIDAYHQYHSNGFQIVGVSLDNNENSWKKAIESYKMTWPQMSDLKGWKSTAASQYGVTAIPFTLLVDQDGKIIAKNLRGKELEEKLAQIFSSNN